MKFVNSLKDYALYCIIIGAICVLYVNTLGHGFVFDDAAVLSENVFVQKGIGGISEILTTGSWDGYDDTVDMHIYRPIQLTVLAIQFEFFGLNPFGYHLVHVCSYILLCCLIMMLLRSVFTEVAGGRVIAFWATLIYAAHPVHTEVVANIKGNGDLLAMLLGVASLIFIWKYVQSKSLIPLFVGAFLFLIALLTKETIVCFVGVAALMLYCFSNCSIKRIALSLIPMLAMVLLYLGIRSLVFGADAQTLTQTTQYDNYVLMADGLSQELGLRFYALGKNLQLCSIPYSLMSMYVYDAVPMVEFWDIRSLFSLAVYLILGCAFLFNFRKGNVWGFALGFYLITLALFSNVLFSIPNILSERWLLMPSLGISIAIAYAGIQFYRVCPKSAICTLSLLMLGYVGTTITRNAEWESNQTLFEADVKTAPRNSMANRFLAAIYIKEAAKNGNDPARLAKAAHYQERMVELALNDAAQHKKLAEIYEALGEHRKAAESFKKVASYITPLQTGAEISYARNLNAGALYHDALPVWEALLEADPDSIEIATGHMVALLKIGKSGVASQRFQRLLDLLSQPNGAQSPAIALNNFGIQLETMGAHAEAATAFGHAASYDSSVKGKARFSRAKNLNRCGNYSAAAPFWQELSRDYPALLDVRIGESTALIGSAPQAAAMEASRQLLSLIESQAGATMTPEHCVAINSIAVSLQHWGFYKLAAGLFGEIASHESSVQGRATFAEANCLNLAELYAQALPHWQALALKYPTVVEVAMGEAWALDALSQAQAAIVSYERAIRLISESDNAVSYHETRVVAEARIESLK